MSAKKSRASKHEVRNPRDRDSNKATSQQTPDKWVVVILNVAKKEGHKILSKFQYDHIVEILKRLVDFGNQEELGDLDIEPIDSFYELKEKGGILGRINLRLYFGTRKEKQELVVAKAYKKEDDSQTPRHVILLVEDRLEEYAQGGLRKSVSVHKNVVAKR